MNYKSLLALYALVLVLLCGVIGGDHKIANAGTSGLYVGNAVPGALSTNIQWLAGVSSPTITQATPTSDVATQNITIQPQAPYASAVTNKNGGSLLIPLAAPVSGNTQAFIEATWGGTRRWTEFYDSADGVWGIDLSTNGGGINGGGMTLDNGSVLRITAAQQIRSRIGGGDGGFFVGPNNNVQAPSAGTGDFGGGTQVLGLATATANPSSALTTSGDFVLFGDSATTNGLSAWSSAKVQTTLAPQGTGTANTQLRQHLLIEAVQRTSSTSATTIWTSASITASHIMTFEAQCSAIDTTALAASSAAARVSGSFVNAAGTVTQLGATTTVFNHGFTTAPSFTISGTTVLLKLTANTTDNTDEQCYITVHND